MFRSNVYPHQTQSTDLTETQPTDTNRYARATTHSWLPPALLYLPAALGDNAQLEAELRHDAAYKVRNSARRLNVETSNIKMVGSDSKYAHRVCADESCKMSTNIDMFDADIFDHIPACG